MKVILTFIFFITFNAVYSQDTSQIGQIDALVMKINASTLPIQRDTLIQDHPELGLKMITYLSMIVNKNELLKFVNFVNTSMTDVDQTRQMTTSSSFYYDHNKLIKVEEYLLESDNKKTMDWYYWDDKLLYSTVKSDEATERAALLLMTSKEMLKKIIK